jgi:mannose-6-phosphate isomerase-like protein (cupin superfamily)
MIKTAEINQRLLEDLAVIRAPKFVPRGGGLSIWWMGDDRITFQATSADTAGAYAFWVDEPPGHVGPPKHVHSREEEGFYVIEGQVQFRAGEINSVLTKDSFIALPKGIPHSWINTSTGQARLITFTAGAGNEGFFLTLGAAGVGPPGPRATLPLEEINARTRRYGVTYMESTDNPLDGALEIGAGRNPTIVLPAEGERLHAGGVVYSVKACGSATSQAYTLIEVHIAAVASTICVSTCCRKLAGRNRFAIIEAWRDPGALNAHAKAASTLQFREKLKAIETAPYDDRINNVLAAKGEKRSRARHDLCGHAC